MIYSRNRFLFNEGTPSGDGGSGEPVKSNDGGQGAVDAKALQEKLDAITANSQKILNEKKELEGKLKAISDAKKIEDGKTSELLNETKAELEREKAEKEALKLKAEEAEKYVNAERERLISQLPDEDKEYAEDIKDLITKMGDVLDKLVTICTGLDAAALSPGTQTANIALLVILNAQVAALKENLK